MFNKAIKQEAKLRLAIAGPSGSGKTYTALALATHLGKKIALVDTEHGSASKYADLFTFDVLEMRPPFNPDRFMTAIQGAQAAGYDVIILDSLSHAWNGTGGLLEMVDQFAARSSSKNTFAAWKEGTPIYNRLIDSIIQSEIHVIATMRSKQDYVIEQDERGKNVPKKLGMAPIQREGFEYEFDVVLSMDIDNVAVVTKTRCSALAGGVFKKPGKDVADILTGWLTGAARQEKPVQAATETRPYSPETFHAKFVEMSETLAAKSTTCTDQDRQIVADAIEGIFDGDKTVRYEVSKWLTGFSSTKEMSPAQIKALMKVMGVKQFNEAPSSESMTEFRAAHAALVTE